MRLRLSAAVTTALVLFAFSGLYNMPPILWTNNGYKISVIFSLLANSRARSNGILFHVRGCLIDADVQSLPNTFEMHRPNLNNVPDFLRFEYAISSPSGHTSYIQKLGSVDEVVI